jgi:hypothetical protein
MENYGVHRTSSIRSKQFLSNSNEKSEEINSNEEEPEKPQVLPNELLDNPTN